MKIIVFIIAKYVFICQFNLTFTEESQVEFWVAQMMETDGGLQKKPERVFILGHAVIGQGEMASNWKRVDLD